MQEIDANVNLEELIKI
jgi:hypothetical protein